jgi:predicted dehydrogenase
MDMADQYRVAVIGVAHMHVNELIKRFADEPRVRIVGVADTVPTVPELNARVRSTRGHTLAALRDAFGSDVIYEDYRRLLEDARPDIVIACPENNRHAEVVVAALEASAHVVTEKPMATTVDEAAAMLRAARRNDRRLAVNYSVAWSGAVRRMGELLAEGAIGDLWQVHERHGSRGPLAEGSRHPGVPGGTEYLTDTEKAATWWHRAGEGGGALLDYCSYGACLARWCFGEPAQMVSAMRGNLATEFGASDDNAVIVARFRRGMAILEASWTCVDHAMPTGPILYGTTGTLSLDDATGRVRLGRGGQPAEFFDPLPLPTGRGTVAREFIHHIESGEPLFPILDPDVNLDATAILDAGIRSAASGTHEIVGAVNWPRNF